MIGFGDFSRMFRDTIRVQLDWEALGEVPVDVVVARSAAELRGWYPPWYRDPGGSCGWNAPEATPIPFDDPELAAREPVATFAAQMREQRSEVVQLVVATYRIRGGELVLDGNHRLAAAVASGRALAVLALSLVGPLDPEVLPDLSVFA